MPRIKAMLAEIIRNERELLDPNLRKKAEKLGETQSSLRKLDVWVTKSDLVLGEDGKWRTRISFAMPEETIDPEEGASDRFKALCDLGLLTAKDMARISEAVGRADALNPHDDTGRH